jgi:hypothetical protein
MLRASIFESLDHTNRRSHCHNGCDSGRVRSISPHHGTESESLLPQRYLECGMSKPTLADLAAKRGKIIGTDYRSTPQMATLAIKRWPSNDSVRTRCGRRDRTTRR